MNEPSQQEEPEDGRQAELYDRHEQPTLHQLTEARYEETTDRRDHIARRTLSHRVNSP